MRPTTTDRTKDRGQKAEDGASVLDPLFSLLSSVLRLLLRSEQPYYALRTRNYALRTVPYTTLVTPALLLDHLDDPDWVVVDCRFSLEDSERGRRDFLQAHIPGAVYAHLDRDLSGPVVAGRTGRHPLPDPAALADLLSGWGIGPGVQVVAYDDRGGAFAARLWWMLGWLGHDAAAVLDGGWPAWQQAGYPARSGAAQPVPRIFSPQLRPERAVEAEAVEAEAVEAARQDAAACLLDARAEARFRGEHEPIDPVAGHIPGARSAPFSDNLDAEGRFLPPEALRARFEALLAGTAPEGVVSYCGSGVTAAHNLLALAHAGLHGARLYPGSWSEWITDPQRPVEKT